MATSRQRTRHLDGANASHGALDVPACFTGRLATALPPHIRQRRLSCEPEQKTLQRSCEAAVLAGLIAPSFNDNILSMAPDLPNYAQIGYDAAYLTPISHSVFESYLTKIH
jgi:hypothetical protein